MKVFLREVPRILRLFPREESEGSLKIFLRQTFSLRPQVCLRKIFWEPSDSSLRNSLRIVGNLPKEYFYHTTLRLDPHFVPHLKNTSSTTVFVSHGGWCVLPVKVAALARCTPAAIKPTHVEPELAANNPSYKTISALYSSYPAL